MRFVLAITFTLVNVGLTGFSIAADQEAQEVLGTSSGQRAHAKSADPHSELSPEKLIQVALQHHQENRVSQALEVLGNALIKYPQNFDLLGVRAALLLEKGAFSASLQDLEAAVKINPTDPGILTNRAQVYRRFQRDDQALEDLNQAIKINPDFIPARFNRGAILFTRGKYQEALEDFNRCIAIEPHVPAPYFNRAVSYDTMGKRALAIADLEHFISIADNQKWKDVAEKMLKDWKRNPSSDVSSPE